MEIAKKLLENIGLIYASLLIPAFIIIIIHYLKKLKKLSQPAGVDFIAVLICFNIGILIQHKPFSNLFIADLRNYIGLFYTTLLFIKIFTLFFCIDVEKKLQERYNFKLKENFIIENDLDVTIEKIGYKVPLSLQHFFAWFFIFVLIFINITPFILQ